MEASVLLNLGDHCDRGLVSLFLGEVIAEERAVPFPFPSDIEIEGDPCFRVPRSDRVVHVALPVTTVAMIDRSGRNIYDTNS